MRVVVLGAGAMGCLFGGLLYTRGHDVTLVDVSSDQIDAINRGGLSLETTEAALHLPIPARYAREVATSPDLLITFTKTFHTRAALESVRHFIGESTRILTLQNGLGNVQVIEDFVPRTRIVHGATTFPADLVGPGRVRSLGSGQTRILSADGALSPALEEIRRALDEAGFRCEISTDVPVAIWEKVAFNAAMNTVAAVTRLTVGQIADSPEGRRLTQRIVEEVVAVAKGKGVDASREAVLETLAGAFQGHRQHKPSMLQDILAGRRTEVESLNGAVVKEADALGMAAPVTETLYLLVRTLEASGGREGSDP